ncbi:MAG: ATP-binding protein [Leadbetterella sp.]
MCVIIDNVDIKRALYTTVFQALKPGKAIIVIGARRTGKTFLLTTIIRNYSGSYLWLNGEDMDTQAVLENRSVANYRRLLAGIELLIIDEAQMIPNIGLILKLIVDELSHIKVLVSGSSAFDLYQQVGEPLVGRAYWYEIFPIAQTELKNHQNGLETIQNLPERLVMGSYPELFHIKSNKEKERYLKSIVDSYLLKDVLSIDGIRNTSKIRDLLQLIAYQIGKEVSMDELGKQLGMSKNTVEKYLDILQKAFVLKKVRAFSRNLRKEIVKSSRWYFIDNGVRNAVINDFKPLALRRDVGELWENYLIMERLKKLNYEQQQKEVYFWRTYDQQEIDWIETQGDTIEAFEFKWNLGKSKVPQAFKLGYPQASFTPINPQNYLEFVE